MKKQTYIAFVYNSENKKTDFHRFGCKKMTTVIKNMIKLYDMPLMKALNSTKEARYFVVYATPDGVNIDEQNKSMKIYLK